MNSPSAQDECFRPLQLTILCNFVFCPDTPNVKHAAHHSRIHNCILAYVGGFGHLIFSGSGLPLRRPTNAANPTSRRYCSFISILTYIFEYIFFADPQTLKERQMMRLFGCLASHRVSTQRYA
eukprot:TRINITY_DN8881_c0_g1_i1.p1 TRINITY_DN8881_c0_g1~~TRINITY_DN8881_c0_g1_i1.p1  ORF type:complete len:123 (+),score=3.88 TRINITY_DN8881_c0_g1_i1:144-512(+)